MEPIAACLALGDRLSWKMSDKYLVRAGRHVAHCMACTLCRATHNTTGPSGALALYLSGV